MRFHMMMTMGLVVMLLALAPSSAAAQAPPAKDMVFQAESRPPQNKPRGSVTLRARPDRPGYDFDKPGRPGGDRPDRYRPNRPGRDRDRDRDRWDRDRDRRPGWDNRPGRQGPSWGYNCYPYCYGVIGPEVTYGNEEEEEDRALKAAAPPPEPERGFQGGGSFERFDDPRPAPPSATGYPRALGGEPDVPAPSGAGQQYRMMMKAWQ